jgi:hypothetical protein
MGKLVPVTRSGVVVLLLLRKNLQKRHQRRVMLSVQSVLLLLYKNFLLCH